MLVDVSMNDNEDFMSYFILYVEITTTTVNCVKDGIYLISTVLNFSRVIVDK